MIKCNRVIMTLVTCFFEVPIPLMHDIEFVDYRSYHS